MSCILTHSLTQSLVFLLFFFTTPTLSVDCWTPQGSNDTFYNFDWHDLWRVRSRLCNNSCPNSSGSLCRLTGDVNQDGLYAGGARVGGLREVPAFPNCWNALREIVVECYRNMRVGGGVWTSGNEQYTLGIYATSDVSPKNTTSVDSNRPKPTTTRTYTTTTDPSTSSPLDTFTGPPFPNTQAITTTSTLPSGATSGQLTATATSTGDNNLPTAHSGLSAGAGAGIGVGATALVAALLALIWYRRIKRLERRSTSLNNNTPELHAGSPYPSYGYYPAVSPASAQQGELDSSPFPGMVELQTQGKIYAPGELPANEDAVREFQGDDLNMMVGGAAEWERKKEKVQVENTTNF